MKGSKAPAGLELVFDLPANDKWLQATIAWPSSGALKLTFDPQKQSLLRNGKQVRDRKLVKRTTLPDVTFARPGDVSKVETLQKPAYSFITGAEATRKRPRFSPMLFDLRDLKKDDAGESGKYTYPGHASYPAGIFDIRRTRIWQNDEFLFVEINYENMPSEEELSPGNRFPALTAMTLKYEKLSTIRRTKIGKNANYSVPHEYAYNFILFIGDGYRLEDGRGRVIAEYQPQAGDRPLLERDEKRLQFSVPLKYLSTRARSQCGSADRRP